MTKSLNPEQMKVEEADKETSANELKKQIQARLGQQLRSARECRELTISEAASQLKIRTVYLQGLESGDWSNLPEEVYVLGFLRQYAALLGENCHEDIEALKSSDYQLTKPYTIPDPPIAPSKMWAVAAAVLFVLLFILFNTVRDDGNESPPAKASVTDTNPVPVIATTEQDIPEAPAEKNIPPAPQLPATSSDSSQKPDNVQMMPQDSSQAPVASSDSGQSSSNVTTVTPSQTKKELPLITTLEKTVEMHRYRLTAIESSAWLQVYDSSGTLLREALLHSGQSLVLESDAPFLTVTCGNAAALKIEVDHALYAAAGTLGAPGKVLRGFRIDASGHDQ